MIDVSTDVHVQVSTAAVVCGVAIIALLMWVVKELLDVD